MEAEELVRQAQAGSAQAMESLIAIWRPRLVRRALQIVRDEDAAQDIVQETLVRVFLNLGGLANPEAFASWVYVILRRVGIAYVRRESKVQRKSVSFDETQAPPIESEPGRELHQQLDLEGCLSQLRPDDRLLVERHYWCGQELREIAPILGIAVGAAKTRLFRVRAQLGELLGGRELICS